MSVQTDYINRIAPIICSKAKLYGYKYPSAIIAQACVESGYGSSSLASDFHNHFGMKCGSAWRGASVNMKTKEEYTAGILTTIADNFRAYTSDDEGITGYFNFIAGKSYTNLKSATSALDYIEKIKADGWATSSTYIKTLSTVWRQYNLSIWDDDKTACSNHYAQADISTETRKRLIDEVLAGKWGNGETRKRLLTDACIDAVALQKAVNVYIASSVEG